MMGKYDHLKEDMFTTRDASDAEVTIVHALVAIANELAELSEFLRERLPRPLSAEDFDNLIKKF